MLLGFLHALDSSRDPHQGEVLRLVLYHLYCQVLDPSNRLRKKPPLAYLLNLQNVSDKYCYRAYKT